MVRPMTDSRLRPPSARQAPVLCRLHDEWQHITIRACELRTVRAWGLPGQPVRTLDELLERCGYRPAPTSADRTLQRSCMPVDDNDEYLLRVVALARTEPLAARIVLQRILPALSAVAAKHSLNMTQRHAVLDELVANAWPIIRKYPTDRRPRRIVANLVRDTAFETFVRPIRRRSSGEIPTAHDHLGEPTQQQTVEAFDELVELLHEARRYGFEQNDIDLLCQIVSLGRPEEVATVLSVTPRTVRNRRDAVVHRLRNLVLEAA